MPQVKFGRKDEPGFNLEMSDDLIAVRTRSRRTLRTAGPVASAVSGELQGTELVAAFPEAGVEVYRVSTGPAAARSVDDWKRTLRDQRDVEFAGRVPVDPQSGEPVLYTENLFIKFRDDVDPDDCRAVIQAAGLTIKRAVDYATNAYFVAAPEGTGTKIFDIALELLERDDVEYCHPELIRRRAWKGIFPQQWHLAPTMVGGVQIQAHANVGLAHEVTLGEGTTIALLDDGFDIDHPEFGSSGKIVAPRDATLGTGDPRPKDPFPRFPDNHGTACAGVACADGNHGASGVAPKAKLLPIRLASNLGSLQEAEAFRWAADHGADVISCSWGPQDGDWFDPRDPVHNQVAPLPASTRLAIDYATTNGRGGKGCVVLFAAGNGNEKVENDGYASYERVIAVAACNDRGRRSVYSDFGRAVWCAFPSSDFGHRPFGHPEPLTPGIWTTDRVGAKGYNDGDVRLGDLAGDYCNDFGGTSSACPGAAGVAALVLAANPDLKWHEVKDILKRSCDRIDPQNGQYDATGHSPLYGYGRLNARTAVELARPEPRNSIVVTRTFDAPIPDLQTISVSLDVGEAATIQSLTVAVDIAHTYIGDLIVTLLPPTATGVSEITLHHRAGGPTRNLRRTFDPATTPALAAFGGKSCKGRWTLQVRDAAAADSGTLVSFGLELRLPPSVPRSVVVSHAAAARSRKREDGSQRRSIGAAGAG
jgi:subtilisin family serine protease